MPPNTHFDDEIFISDGRVTVQGTLDAPEEDVRRAIVFAFVTQEPLEAGKEAATVAGEVLLYPVKDSESEELTWWLVDPLHKANIEPTVDLLTPGEHDHSYHFAYKQADKRHFGSDIGDKNPLQWAQEWYFGTDIGDKNPLKGGAAFGTAIMVTFTTDGSIETYSWSGWVEVVDNSPSTAPSE